MLLTRDDFREKVFSRDNNRCVICKQPAVDAHHIIERRLWPDGGYYTDNGASVCGMCHIKCEQTIISVREVREAANIKKIVLPPHMYRDQEYDKWGNCILPNGNRTKGELFSDESVQKILREGKVLHLFTDYVKYPRTYHLPWSLGVSEDDRILTDLSSFYNQRVIVTEKMDGENTTWYKNYIHARSIDSGSHPSRDRVKAMWSTISYDIPEGWRICGENLYAKHSIEYTSLLSYFYAFSIWNDRNICISWDDTLEWLSLLNIVHVPILYDGVYSEDLIRNLLLEEDLSNKEGYVVRLAREFSYGEFKTSVAKFVRKNHVTTDQHWMLGKPIVPNKCTKNLIGN